jgi:hypothetical protein
VIPVVVNVTVYNNSSACRIAAGGTTWLWHHGWIFIVLLWKGVHACTKRR